MHTILRNYDMMC